MEASDAGEVVHRLNGLSARPADDSHPTPLLLEKR